MASQNDLKALREEIESLRAQAAAIGDAKDDPSLDDEYDNLLQSKQNLLAFIAENTKGA